MAGRFVRASKYRHVFGNPAKKEASYDNLHISRNAWDTNLVKANPEYLSVNWEASGGGAFAVIPINEKGRLPEQIPLFRGHTAPVLDTDWNPFNDRIIASGSDDGKVFIWQVPQGFTLHSEADEPQDVAPLSKLAGHTRKIGQVLFNPAAENILASASGDYTIKIWDIGTGQSSLTLKHKDVIQSLSWSADGSMMVTTSRDKRLRIWDVRQEKAVHEVASHSGAKASRAVWMGEHNRVATTGFSKMSDRQIALWDVGNPVEPIGGFTTLDSISGVLMPFWDEGTQCLYLAGKGDGNIRYYEYENDKFEFLSEYKSGEAQRGIAVTPRRGLKLHDNEVMRCYKTVNDTYIQPVSFTVPRRAEVFQSDIFPPATGTKPGVSAADWLAGKTALPPKIDLESVYEGHAPTEVPADYKPPAPTSAAAPIKAASPVKKDLEPTPVVQKAPLPTMAEQKGSISAMASKFKDAKEDEDDDDDDDDDSSFEEIAKPVVRHAPKPEPMAPSSPVASRTTPPAPVSQATPKSTEAPAPAQPTTIQTSSGPIAAVGSTPSAASGAIESSLEQIKGMLEAQTKFMTTQSEKISQLAAEVDMLKLKVGTGSQDQSERIRQLELELEAARS
ncbi:MAG: Coronin-like protein crn1 [Claussenomyces sp. TS43310]|nr:MAG: Coronin-like protein crn1 [Claussenomyces sp. TS43310]